VGHYWPICSYCLTQHSAATNFLGIILCPNRLTSNHEIWHSNSFGKGTGFYGQASSCNFRKHPQILRPQHMPTRYGIMSNPVLQGDHKWELTFYRVHHAAQHSERGLRVGEFVIPLRMLILFAIANLPVVWHSCNFHSFSDFHYSCLRNALYCVEWDVKRYYTILLYYTISTVPLNFVGAPNFVLCPRNCLGTAQYWGLPNKIFLKSARLWALNNFKSVSVPMARHSV